MPKAGHDPRTGRFTRRRRSNRRRRSRNALVAGGSYYSFNRPRRRNRRRRSNKRGHPLSGSVYRPRIGTHGLKPFQETRIGFWTGSGLRVRRRKAKAGKKGRKGVRRAANRRRRRLNWGAGYASNPPRRRRRSNRRHRHYNTGLRRRRRFNGLLPSTSGFMRNVRELIQMNTWIGVGQGALGFSAAIVVPRQLAKLTGRNELVRGWTGVATSAVSAALSGAVASAAGERAARNVFIGGLIATIIRVVGALSPQTARDYLTPLNGGGAVVPMVAMAPAAAAAAPAAAAAAPGGGVKGLGRLVSPEQLMAGESRARGLLGMGDWVELTGVQNMDDQVLQGAGVSKSTLCGLNGYAQRVPANALRGMGDWMEFKPQDVGSGREIPSFSPSSKEVF